MPPLDIDAITRRIGMVLTKHIAKPGTSIRYVLKGEPGVRTYRITLAGLEVPGVARIFAQGDDIILLVAGPKPTGHFIAIPVIQMRDETVIDFTRVALDAIADGMGLVIPEGSRSDWRWLL